MSQLYYPGFEISNEEWLKYALLYKEKIYTIIPYETENYWMSPQYHYVKNETNLLSICRPMIEAGEKTSREVIELLESMLAHPERYFTITRTRKMTTLVEKWNNKRDYILFQGKYSLFFEKYLIDSGFGVCSDKGVKVNKDIGLIYMAQLASNIAKSKDYDLATDKEEYKKIQQLFQSLWDKNNNMEYYKAAEVTINEYLPRNIKDISLKHIVQLRNEENYMDLLHSYNETIRKFVNDLESERQFSVESYVNDMRMLNRELSGQILSVLGACTVVASAILTSNINENIAKAISTALGTAALTGTILAVQPNVNQYGFKNRVKARKFISKLKKLNKI